MALKDHAGGSDPPANRRPGHREEIFEAIIPEDQLPNANPVAQREPRFRTQRDDICEDIIPEDQVPNANPVAQREPRPWDRARLEDKVRLVLTGVITGIFVTILAILVITALNHQPVTRGLYTAMSASGVAEGWVLRYFFTHMPSQKAKRAGRKKQHTSG